jgi:hypothetical protein
MKGLYHPNNEPNLWAARITRGKKGIYLGAFETEVEAAKVYDAACWIYGKVPSAYNYPYEPVNRNMVMKVLALLRDKGALTNEDIVAISNRYDILNSTSVKVEGIANGSFEQD